MPQSKQQKRKFALTMLKEAHMRWRMIVRPGTEPSSYTAARIKNLDRMISELEVAIARNGGSR
jgi:hypothetical protein